MSIRHNSRALGVGGAILLVFFVLFLAVLFYFVLDPAGFFSFLASHGL